MSKRVGTPLNCSICIKSRWRCNRWAVSNNTRCADSMRSAQSDKATSCSTPLPGSWGKKIPLSSWIALPNNNCAGETPITSLGSAIIIRCTNGSTSDQREMILLSNNIVRRNSCARLLAFSTAAFSCFDAASVNTWSVPMRCIISFMISAVKCVPLSDTIWLGHPKRPTWRISILAVCKASNDGTAYRPIPRENVSITVNTYMLPYSSSGNGPQ